MPEIRHIVVVMMENHSFDNLLGMVPYQMNGRACVDGFDRHGRNDGFVRASGPIAMRFWDKRDLPFTYSLVEHFPLAERYFSSSLCQTYPNRRFFFTGTASGTISTDNTTFSTPAANGTIFDRLEAHKINYGIYAQQLASWLIIPDILKPPGRNARMHPFDQFTTATAFGCR